jgi:hypothetical protein
MSPLTAEAVTEVAAWIRNWRGPDADVMAYTTPEPRIVAGSQVYEADAISRLVIDRV